ncbi:MAG: tyrosine-type recombinase/integrase [Ignavibacteriaceae bacterium]
MDGITNLLSKLSMEDIEKLKVLMSVSAEAESKEVITLRLFTNEYKTLIQNNRSATYYRSVTVALNYLESYFKPQRVISGITLKDVESFLVYLKQKVVKGYVVYFRNLKAAFNKAKDWGYVKENYFTKIKLPKRQRIQPAYIDSRQLEEICRQMVQESRQKAVSSRQEGKDNRQLTVSNRQEEKDNRHERQGSWHKENDVVRDVAVIGFYTGMRLNEIVNLRWKNVDLKTQVVTVGDEDFITKGRKQRFIPICDEAMEVLKRRSGIMEFWNNGRGKKEKTSGNPICQADGEATPEGGPARILPMMQRETLIGYVFCKSKGVKFTGDYFSKRFKSACIKVGIDKSIHFHSLRHSFASNLVQKGVSLYKIKELLGHSSITTTEIYSHLDLDSLREAIKTLDDSSEQLSIQSTTRNKKSSPGLRIITTRK